MLTRDYTRDQYGPINANFTTGSGFAAALPIASQLPASVSNRMLQSAIVQATHEQLRALLTKSALDNVGALSAYEAHLQDVAPLGSARYKAINDVFALSAVMRLARW